MQFEQIKRLVTQFCTIDLSFPSAKHEYPLQYRGAMEHYGQLPHFGIRGWNSYHNREQVVYGRVIEMANIFNTGYDRHCISELRVMLMEAMKDHAIVASSCAHVATILRDSLKTYLATPDFTVRYNKDLKKDIPTRGFELSELYVPGTKSYPSVLILPRLPGNDPLHDLRPTDMTGNVEVYYTLGGMSTMKWRLRREWVNLPPLLPVEKVRSSFGPYLVNIAALSGISSFRVVD